MMAFRANGLSGPIYARGDAAPRPALVECDGVSFGPRRTIYAGKPTPAQIEADNLNLLTLAGKPWPGSATDRYCVSPPDNAPKRTKSGAEIHMAGPRSMERAELDGRWPDEEERKLQAFAEAKLKEPRKIGLALLKAQGVTGEKAEAILAKNRHSGIPDPAELLATVGSR